MLKKIMIFLFLIPLFSTSILYSQNKNMPKLVVGIVVDQMRYDYLTKYEDKFSEGGFKRLMTEGSFFTNAHLNYIPAYTAPGHSSIYTGTTPNFHGIIANDYFDRFSKKMIYCLDDSSYYTLGGNDDAGEVSPKNLLASTITDELKLYSNGKSKIVSASIKDRGAVIPGGHLADQVYWYDKNNGNFISSTYYMDNLPAWVIRFNAAHYAESYMNKEWNLLLPYENYSFAIADDSPWEEDVFSENKHTFPHSFSNLSEDDKIRKLPDSPFGNDMLFDFVEEAIDNEQLGKSNVTDFLAVSFSSTDYIGHAFGPNSYEIMDTYLRLDRIIEKLLKKLDETAGYGNYIVFLTADHAGSDAFGYLKKDRMPTGAISTKDNREKLYSFAAEKYGDSKIIENYSNLQIFLNYDYMQQKNLDPKKVRAEFAGFLKNNFTEISKVFTRDELENLYPERDGNNFVRNGYNSLRSGDIAMELQPGMVFWEPSKHASTHETRYSYDSHIPLLFYGWNIPVQRVNSPVYVVDIAPTVADLLGIREPNCSIGIPLINKIQKAK